MTGTGGDCQTAHRNVRRFVRASRESGHGRLTTPSTRGLMAALPPHTPAAPPLIPGLELGEKIGEGGMGVVYRAVHLNLQRGVAVKVLHAHAAPAWPRESRLLAALAHPAVVAVHDSGQVGGVGYLVMEYLEGGSLRDRMGPGRAWPPADAAAVLDQVAAALEHVHARGVLHLDLKPENILYAADGRVKVADFGLAVPAADARALLGGSHLWGTADYSAPELLSGLPPDARYDVFSLATLAYELLTGRLPGRVYVPASSRNPHLPAALDAVLARGLAREPGDRYPSVAEFRQALARAGLSSPARTGRRRAAVAVAGVVALAAVLAAALWPKPDPPPDAGPGEPERPAGPTGPGAGRVEVAPPPRPATRPRVWLVYDTPDDLGLIEGAEIPGVAADHIRVERDKEKDRPTVPGLAVWPVPRPAAVVHSPGIWGFVHPFQDRALARRVVENWGDLTRTPVPPGGNLVRAGGFDTDPKANPWGPGKFEWEKERRNITVAPPPGRPGNPALLLTHLTAGPNKEPVGCSQAPSPPARPGSAVVLRYRARAAEGSPPLVGYVAFPAVVPLGDNSPAAQRLRKDAVPTRPRPGDAGAGRWSYRPRDWVRPSADWQTYLLVAEVPPFSGGETDHNLVIDLGAGGRVWVDDVELFVW